jgi:tetratricopeptide (TPR) repeat protein
MERIPDHLINRIQRGEVILFLGAGASIGSKNSRGQSPPLGYGLMQILANECGIPLSDGDDLQTVAGNAHSKLGDAQYWKILRENYLHCTPSEGLQIVARYYWPRIYSLNIDDATENAFRESGVHRADVFIGRSPIVSADTSGTPSVQVVKLNGSVDRLEGGLIFSRDDFNRGIDRTATWYDEMVRDYFDKTFVIIGTKLDEPIFWHHISRFIANSGQAAGTSYIICPTFSEHKKYDLERHKIIPIQGTLDEFAREISRVLGQRISIADVSKFRNPSLFAHLSDGTVKSALAENPSEQRALTIISREILERTNSRDPASIRGFYLGQAPTWRDILDGVPARIGDVAAIVKRIATEAPIIVIEGPAGTGKSTCAMMAALEIADQGSATVLWVDGSIGVPTHTLNAFLNDRSRNRGRCIIFVDAFARVATALQELIKVHHGHGNHTFVLCDRTARIRHSHFRDANSTPVKISKILTSDVDVILERVERFGPWGFLSKLRPEERRNLLLEKAEKVLLVALREATSGKGYDEIISSEFHELPVETRMACAFVSLASTHSLGISRKTLTAAIVAFCYPADAPDLNRVLTEDVIYSDRGGSYRMRHSIIAEYVLTRLTRPSDALKYLRAVFLALSRYRSPLRDYADTADSVLYAAISNHEFLWSTFRSVKSEVILMLKECEAWFRDDALFWLQYALFEQRCDRLRDAIDHIRIALSIYPSSFQITNAFANIHFAASVASGSAQEGLAIMEDATKIMESQMKDPQTEPYAVVGLCKGRLKAVMKWIPSRGATEKRALERLLKDAMKKYPQNHDIRNAITELQHIYAQQRVAQSSSGHRRGTGDAKQVKRTPAKPPSGNRRR